MTGGRGRRTKTGGKYGQPDFLRDPNSSPKLSPLISQKGETRPAFEQWMSEQEGRAGRPRAMNLVGINGQWLAIVTATVIWGVTVGIGFLALQLHGASPGQGGLAVELWPDQSRVPLTGVRPTLIIAAHPLCPCTRATVAELTRILSKCSGHVEVYVLIFLPERAGHGWCLTDGMRGLGTMPGVHLIDDPGGEEAARFGARTSGLVALYARDGRLLFRGGITGVGGHEGDNAGRRALLGLIHNDSSSHPRETPVFGCPLFPTPPLSAGNGTPWKK
jgi:hypothetical protein